MRVLYITEWFDPEPTPKGLAFAKRLVELGHDVQVLTGFPNYPGGKVYPGYRIKLFQREVHQGVSILRVPVFPSHDRSAIRRIATYLSYALSSCLLAPLLLRKFDLMYVYSPPPTSAVPAVFLKILFRKPFVYDIQDLWPDTLIATDMVRFRWMLKGVEWWCQLVYRMASHITVLSPGFKTKLIERGVPPEKVTVVYNWADDSAIGIENVPVDVADSVGMTPETFNILFAGTMGLAQGLDAVLKAAETLQTKLPKVRFFLIGGGVQEESLREMAEQMGLNNVTLLPKRRMTEMAGVLNAADVLLVHLKRNPLFDITIPSKTQAYLAAGKPILLAVDGDAANLIRRSSAGVVCRPEDPDDLVAKVDYLCHLPKHALKQMGSAGREFYEKELSMDVGVRNLTRVLEKCRIGLGARVPTM